jgi:hypothetical protein
MWWSLMAVAALLVVRRLDSRRRRLGVELHRLEPKVAGELELIRARFQAEQRRSITRPRPPRAGRQPPLPTAICASRRPLGRLRPQGPTALREAAAAAGAKVSVPPVLERLGWVGDARTKSRESRLAQALIRLDLREQAELAGRGDGFSGEASASGVVERGENPLRLRNRPSRPRNTRYPKGCGSRSGRASAGSDFSREEKPRLPCPGDSASANPSGELPNEPLMNRKLTGDSDTAAREGLRCGGSSPWDATGVPRGKGPPFQRERNIRPAPGRGLFPSCRGSGTRD